MQTTFLSEFECDSTFDKPAPTSSLIVPAWETKREKSKINYGTQNEMFSLMGLPTTDHAAQMSDLMARIEKKESAGDSRQVVRRDNSEWIIVRSGTVVSISLGLDGNEDLLLSRDCEHINAAIAFAVLAAERIKEGRGLATIPKGRKTRPNATGGNRYAVHGKAIRSDEEARALVDSDADALAKVHRAVVARYQHCIERDEIENLVEIAIYNAAITYDAEKTRSVKTGGKTRPFRAYATMCAKNRCRKVIAHMTNYGERMPAMDSLDSEVADVDSTLTRYDLVSSNELTPAEICEQNDFRERRGFAKAEADGVLILLVLCGAWIIPACENIGRTFRGWFSKSFRIFA